MSGQSARMDVDAVGDQLDVDGVIEQRGERLGRAPGDRRRLMALKRCVVEVAPAA